MEPVIRARVQRRDGQSGGRVVHPAPCKWVHGAWVPIDIAAQATLPLEVRRESAQGTQTYHSTA